MRYGTWTIAYSSESSENGTTPVGFSGSFFSNIEQNEIAGYIPKNAVIEDYSLWSAKEITAEQFLALAQQVNSSAELNDNGFIWFPPVEALA